MSEVVENLWDFVIYAQGLDGDEKGEAQVFCDRLFRAFGYEGYKEAGAERRPAHLPARPERRACRPRGGRAAHRRSRTPAVGGKCAAVRYRRPHYDGRISAEATGVKSVRCSCVL